VTTSDASAFAVVGFGVMNDPRNPASWNVGSSFL